MPRPRSLTEGDLATAALAVIRRDGLPALTMRAVATELGMGTMSIYRYVTAREQLEALVVEHVLGTVDLALPRRASWTKSVTLLAERVREAVSVHPAVVPLLLIHRQSSQSSLRWAETVLGVLTDAGFGAAARVIAFRTLLAFVIGALQVEYLGALSGAGTATIADLPRSAYPLLAETARHAQRVSVEQEFGQGLAVVLAGLEPLRTPPRAD